MKRVLVVVFGPVSTDPRVLRQIDALSDSFDVTVAGFGPFEDSRVEFQPLGSSGPEGTRSWKAGRLWQLLEVGLCALRLYSLSYWLLHPAHFRFKRYIQSAQFDLILINDSEGVAVSTRFARGNPVVIHDQHEYWPDLFINPLKKWAVAGYRRWYVKKYLSPLPHWITVADGIGELYRKTFDMTKPVVITNAPGFVELQASDVADNRVDLVYHGIWDPGRGIEVMIEALSHIPEHFHLNLIIVGSGKDHLRGVAGQFQVLERVHFHDPVQPRDIAAYINRFDVALIMIMPVNASVKFALPNKLFESIQGRLAIVTGPSPEIEKVVKGEQCGIVLDDFGPESLAKSLTTLSFDDIRQLKERSGDLAKSLSAEENGKILRRTVSDLLADSSD